MPLTFTTVCHEDQDEDKFASATKVALETGNITPLVKQELKYTIQSRRLAEGKNELDVQFMSPLKHELTPEEVKKKERRRDQNRIAAKRFRKKQITSANEFKQRIEHLESENTKLTTECARLSREKNYLRGKLQAHLYICGSVAYRDS